MMIVCFCICTLETSNDIFMKIGRRTKKSEVPDNMIHCQQTSGQHFSPHTSQNSHKKPNFALKLQKWVHLKKSNFHGRNMQTYLKNTILHKITWNTHYYGVVKVTFEM